MGKLNLKVVDAPIKVAKNDEAYKEVAEAFNSLPIGKGVEVSNEEVSSLSLITNIKKFITLKEGEEDIRISRLYGNDKKLSGVRLVKQAFKPKKSKTEPQGKTETSKTE